MPDAQSVAEHRLTASQYRSEIARILMDAAGQGVIPRELRAGRRFRLASMTTMSGAQMLVNSLCASDLDRERWACVSALSPEINYAVRWARRLQRMEEDWQQGEHELRQLRAKALATLSDSAGGSPAARGGPGASATAAR